MSSDLSARYRGCLLGLAIGDAVGTTLEFKAPRTFAPLTDMVGGGPFGLQPGQWTDDTSMALCLAESLVACGGFDAIDQLRRYVRWYREGYLSSTGECFDIGNTVRQALHRFEHAVAFTAAPAPECGSTHPQTAGNGSLMRLAPVPMRFRADPAQAIEQAGASSRTTHGAPTAVDACRYYAGLIVGALNGVAKEVLLAPLYAPVPGYWQTHALAPEVAAVAAGSFKTRQPPAIRGSGYVVHSLEAALWAFYTTTTFREGCLLAANLGEDADTTAAIYGQLAGAFYGAAGLPTAWVAQVAQRPLLETLADQLLAAASG